MAKKRSSRSQQAGWSVPDDDLPGIDMPLEALSDAFGISEEELLRRFESLLTGGPPKKRPARRKRRMDPTAKEWRAFEVITEADVDDHRSFERDLDLVRSLDPRCAMAPITLAYLGDAPLEVAVSLHRDALAMLGERVHVGNFKSLAGDDSPLGHPYCAPFLLGHRFVGLNEMHKHRYAEAIPHFEALNATEFEPLNQSLARSCLALCHLYFGRDAVAGECLGEFKEQDAIDNSECLTQALLEFRTRGDTPAATHWLDLADARNPYVISMFLNGDDDLDPEDPNLLEEAQDYWAIALPVWRETDGTMPWIRQRLLQSSKRRKPSLSQRKEVAEHLVEELLKVPVGDDTWRIVVREDADSQNDDPKRLIVAYVTSEDGIDLIESSIIEQRPKTEDLLRLLVEVFQNHDDLARPREILLEDKRLIRLAERGFGMCGIQVRRADPLPELNQVIEQHFKHLQEATNVPDDTLADAQALFAIDGSWLVGFGRMNAWIDVEGQLVRPWFGIVVTPEGIRRFHQTVNPTITKQDWEVLLCSAMCHPLIGNPGIPEKLIFRDAPQKEAAHEVWQALEIDAGVIDSGMPDVILECIVDCSQRIEPESRLHHPLSKIEGITTADLEQFYTAACDYHRAAPWRLCGESTSLTLKGGDWPTGRVMCTMGEGGLTQGLAVYFNRSDFNSARVGGRVHSLAVLFDEPQLAAFPDLDLIEAHGWPLSSGQAYPVAFLTHGPESLEIPSRSDIQMLTAAMRMIPQIIKNPQQPLVMPDIQGRTLTLKAELFTVHVPNPPASGTKTESQKGRKKK